jgi:hypothetical protein
MMVVMTPTARGPRHRRNTRVCSWLQAVPAAGLVGAASDIDVAAPCNPFYSIELGASFLRANQSALLFLVAFAGALLGIFNEVGMSLCKGIGMREIIWSSPMSSSRHRSAGWRANVASSRSSLNGPSDHERLSEEG